MTEAPLSTIYDPGQVRLSQLGERLLELLEQDLDTDDVAWGALGLHFGLEGVARLPADETRTARLIGQLIEQYGLLAVGLDPFLRPLLPPVPAEGAEIRPFVLGGKTFVLGLGAFALGCGARLVPVAADPSSDTTLPIALDAIVVAASLSTGNE